MVAPGGRPSCGASPGSCCTGRPAAYQAGYHSAGSVASSGSASPPGSAQEIADAIAYSYYEQLARGEFSVDITTTLASGIPLQDNDETGADVLYMLPADPVRCIVDPAVPENGQISLSSEIAAMGVPELQAKIVGGGTVAPAIAYRAALATVDPSTQTDFYCQDVIVGWDAARGFEFQIKATNYLDARWSIEAVNGP